MSELTTPDQCQPKDLIIIRLLDTNQSIAGIFTGTTINADQKQEVIILTELYFKKTNGNGSSQKLIKYHKSFAVKKIVIEKTTILELAQMIEDFCVHEETMYYKVIRSPLVDNILSQHKRLQALSIMRLIKIYNIFAQNTIDTVYCLSQEIARSKKEIEDQDMQKALDSFYYGK